jgi:hypothetical protein
MSAIVSAPARHPGGQPKEGAMHPLIIHELARIKIAEELEYAERRRRYRAANQGGARAIDFGRLVARVRLIVGERGAGRPAPAEA